MSSLAPKTPRFAAFQYRDFRLQWIGQGLSIVGSEMQARAVDWHVYGILGDKVTTLPIFGQNVTVSIGALGLAGLGLTRIVPIILFALFGGTVADILDRRRILIWSQIFAAVFAGVLAVFTLTGSETIPLLYIMTALITSVGAFSNPARQALIPNLVPREHLTSATSLNVLMYQFATVLGPLLMGVLIGAFTNPGYVYAVNAISFGVMLVALLMMRYRGQERPERVGLSMNSMIEGLRFTYDTRLIWSTMLLDFVATFFSSARSLLPIVARDILKVGPEGFGALAAAESVGAALTGAVLVFRKSIRRQGVVLLSAVVVYGLATILFGVSPWFGLAFLGLAMGGGADTVSAVIRSTLRQMITPDHLRGRMVGVNMMFFMGGPQLGELEAGMVASVLGAPFAIISGGILTVLFTLGIAWRYPSLRNYVSDDLPGVAAGIANAAKAAGVPGTTTSAK
jgi:MFS family permease